MTKNTKPTERQKEAMISNILDDFVTENSADDLLDYFKHIRLDVGAIPMGADNRMVLEHCYDHYRQDGVIDIDRACEDLALYPPIAAEIIRLQGAKLTELTNHPD